MEPANERIDVTQRPRRRILQRPKSQRGTGLFATVLAVLERTLAANERGLQLMTALGPGFSAAMCLLELG